MSLRGEDKATNMSDERLSEVKRQIIALTMNEKLDLAAFLDEQVRKDQEAEAVESNASNGQAEAFDPYRRRELEWLKQHDKEYAGQYLALFGDRLIAHAENLRDLDRLVKQSGVKRAVITRITALGEIPFGRW
jgi:hypothetical protein